jgi:hypothetical protein
VFQWNTHLCVVVGKQRNEKYTLSLRLELVKVGGYDFPHPCDDQQNSHIFFECTYLTLSLTCLLQTLLITGDSIVVMEWDYIYIYIYETADPTGTLSIPQITHEWIWSKSGMILAEENRRSRRKTWSSATLSIIYPTRTYIGDGYGTALINY